MLLEHLKQSLNLLLKNKLLLALFIIVDVAFFASLVYVQTNLYFSLGEYSSKLFETIKETTALNLTNASEIDAVLAQNVEFMKNYNQFIKYFTYLILSFLGLFAVFQGINWFIAHKIVNEKFSVLKFTWQFLFWTLFWFLALVALQILLVSSGGSAGLFMALGTLAVIYFGTVSFARIGQQSFFKQTFRTAIDNWRELTQAVAISFFGSVIVLGADYYIFYNVNYWVGILFGLIVVLPIFAFARIFVVEAVKSLSEVAGVVLKE